MPVTKSEMMFFAAGRCSEPPLVQISRFSRKSWGLCLRPLGPGRARPSAIRMPMSPNMSPKKSKPSRMRWPK